MPSRVLVDGVRLILGLVLGLALVIGIVCGCSPYSWSRSCVGWCLSILVLGLGLVLDRYFVVKIQLECGTRYCEARCC